MGEIDKLIKIIRREIESKNYETALAAISACSHYYYEYNQFFCDEYLENATRVIAENYVQQDNLETNSETIVFYDGFGLDTRGLALIYLKALTNLDNKKVVYIVDESARERQPAILKAVNKDNFIVEYARIQGKYVEQIEVLIQLFKKYRPANAFLYTYPYDVSAIVVFELFEQVTRFQINLTDHAFWLGKNAFDYCLEFRDFGYSVSKKFRKIDEEKLVLMPFYPYVDVNLEFGGFPFEIGKSKIIFSGGSLYKTISKDNTYYQIVDYILHNHGDTVFLYAGSGDSTRLDELIRKYPRRVYHIDERKDLYQIMLRCSLYLNTYPLLGGLMTQYAVAAGKLPITLKNGQVQDGFLINQRDTQVFYDTKEDLLNDVGKLLSDMDYKQKRERILLEKECLISSSKFQKELESLISYHTTSYRYEELEVDIESLRKEYEIKFNRSSIQKVIVTKRTKVLYKYFPRVFVSKILCALHYYRLSES